MTLLSRVLFAQSIELIGIIVFEGFGTQVEGLHLYINVDITDLRDCGFGVAHNGGGTDSLEYTFPAQAFAAGSHLFFIRIQLE